MSENTNFKIINQMIQHTMNVVDINIEIKRQSSGINMSYNFIGNYIGFDAERIYEAILELQNPIALESYIHLFTMHELGHALDRKALLESLPRTLEFFEMKRKHSLHEQYNAIHLLAMIIEEHEMNIRFEETAWMNAENLNVKHHVVDMILFQKLKMHSLATYQNLYENDLHLYNELIEKQNKQIS